MNPTAENYLQAKVLPVLDRGRPGWDKPHTQAVVSYVKQILASGRNFKLDPDVLIIAAYAHDWGYADLFERGRIATRSEISDQKSLHMKLGAQKIQKLLTDPPFDYLTLDQKARVVHLVGCHDKLAELKDPDELVLMEADTLAAADPAAVTPTHTHNEYRQYLIEVEKDRISRFITAYSKVKVRSLLRLRQEYYDKHPELG